MGSDDIADQKSLDPEPGVFGHIVQVSMTVKAKQKPVESVIGIHLFVLMAIIA
jgi:hypothetical protein